MRALVKRLVAISSMMLVLFSYAANAQDCENPENPKNQMEMNACAGEAFRQADDDLRSVYHKIRNRISVDPVFRAMLQSSESSWTAYRDAQCLFALGPYAGGSSELWARFTCLERLTRIRLSEMQPFLACGEGTLFCNVPSEP